MTDTTDEPEAWVDHDYTPPPRHYEKCEKCGADLVLTHHCIGKK